MKQKDILLIVVVVIVSAVVSIFVTNAFISPPKNRQAKVEVVDPIVAEFDASPDSKYFNAQSVNPTKLIQIQSNQNTNPFSGN
jgi:hypothetical protein